MLSAKVTVHKNTRNSSRNNHTNSIVDRCCRRIIHYIKMLSFSAVRTIHTNNINFFKITHTGARLFVLVFIFLMSYTIYNTLPFLRNVLIHIISYYILSSKRRKRRHDRIYKFDWLYKAQQPLNFHFSLWINLILLDRDSRHLLLVYSCSNFSAVSSWDINYIFIVCILVYNSLHEFILLWTIVICYRSLP